MGESVSGACPVDGLGTSAHPSTVLLISPLAGLVSGDPPILHSPTPPPNTPALPKLIGWWLSGDPRTANPGLASSVDCSLGQQRELDQ